MQRKAGEMEAILRSVLLRQEQMAMQWDAEFEQQKQLFHINTSTLIDMLPIRPRKKRVRAEGRVPAGPIASLDKENLVGQGFLPGSGCAKSPKARAQPSRGLAKRDLNTRFCDNDVKHAVRMHSEAAVAEPAVVEGANAENVQQSGRVARAVGGSNPVSLGVSVKVEVDEGDAPPMRVSPPTDETASSPGESRKRARGKDEETAVVRTDDGEEKQVWNDLGRGTMGAERKGAGEKKSKAKKARVVAGAEDNAAGEQTCGVSQIAASREPEIVIKVEAVEAMEAEERTRTVAVALEAIQPAVGSEGPALRGRAKGASAASRAAVKDAVVDIVSKEPVRRGRAKKAATASGAAEPVIGQRVTRSRARKVESGVEFEAGVCERTGGTRVGGKESGQEKEKVAAELSRILEDPGVGNCGRKQGEVAADCDDVDESRSAKQMAAGKIEEVCEHEVCAAPSGVVSAEEASMEKPAKSIERKPAVRSRRKQSENNSVAGDMRKSGRIKVTTQSEPRDDVGCSNVGGEEQSARVASRVAEILSSVANSSAGDVKGGEEERWVRPGLARIEENVGHGEAEFASAEDNLPGMAEEAELPGGCAPLAPCAASPSEEEIPKNARCFASSATDMVVGVDAVERTKEVARMQVKVTGDGRQAGNKRSLRSSAAQRQGPGEAVVTLPAPGSGETIMNEVPKAMPTNTGEAYSTLLSQVIEGNTSALAKSDGPASTPESVVVIRPHKSSPCTRGAGESVAAARVMPGAGGDASTNLVEVLPTEFMTRKSIVADGSVDGRGASGEEAVEDSMVLCSGRQAAESDNVVLEECSMEANIELAEGSWGTKEECVQDVVANSTLDGALWKGEEKQKQSIDGASLVDASGEDQVESHAVTPARFSEARAIEEAMRCSLEQEFHPEVTETLNRYQFRRRLSPRSKARARRWRSDVATNGVDFGRGQSCDGPAASPSRAVSSRDRSLEGAAYESFVEAHSPFPEAAMEVVETGFSSDAEKAVDDAETASWQDYAPQAEGIARRSIASLCNEVLSQGLHDEETTGDSVEYEVMKTAEERNGNLSPLLRSIYKLSKACQNEMVGVGGILEEEEQQQVQTLIESARKIMEQVSSRRGQAAGAPPRTPASEHPAPESSRFYDHTSLYPEQFRLFITPGPSSAALPIGRPCAGMFTVGAPAAVGGVVPGDAGSTSPPMKHLIEETMEEAVSKASEHDSALSESSMSGDDAVSPGRSRTPRSGEVRRMAPTGNIHDSGEDVHGSTIVGGSSGIGCASPVRGSQTEGGLRSCNGSIVSIGDRVGAGSAVELVSHGSEAPLSSEAATTTEKLSELRSRFYALSKECVAGGSSTGKDVPNLLGSVPEASTKHSANPPSPMPSRGPPQGCAPKHGRGARVSVRMSRHSLVEGDLDDGRQVEPATVMEVEARIPCSPIFVGKQRGHDKVDEDVVTDGLSPSHHGAEKAVAIKEEAVVLEGTSGACEEAVARTECIATASAAFVLQAEPQRPSNLIGGVPGAVSSCSNPPRSNIVASIRSFVPLVQQQQPAAPYPNGKRDVKVKALEAAEAAKRLAEQKELEKQERKRAAEIAKREKQERAAQEKLAKREKAAQEKLMKQQEARAEKEENEEASRRWAAATGTAKSVLADSSNCQATGGHNVLSKVKRTYELKQKMDQDKQERLLEEQRRKEEEWKKKEAENAARKRKHEADEKREREEKRRRQEDAVKAQREMEERQRLELEKKAQRQKALEDMEKERKAIEEEMKRQKRLEKEREVEQRRKKEQEKEVAWLDQKEITRKRKEEASKQMKLLEMEGRQQALKMRRPSEDPAMPSSGPYQSFISSVYVAMGIGEGVGGAHLSGVNNLADAQRVSSQSLAGHPLRVPQRSGEGAGAAFTACRSSQAAVRVPRLTPESAPGVASMVGGSGKPLFRTPPEASGTTAVGSAAATSGGASAGRALREGADLPHGQSGWKGGVPAVAGGSKASQPGQVGFAGPPGGAIGQGDKGVQTYEISPFRDSDDEDSEEEERRSQKPIPQWARRENIWAQLVRQHQQDPDDIFVGASSCSLDEVFKVKGSKKRPDFKRRGSSGDWVQDCLTWQEQIQYKVTMGYLQ